MSLSVLFQDSLILVKELQVVCWVTGMIQYYTVLTQCANIPELLAGTLAGHAV